MNNKQFNEQRHNRKKQQYRFVLGIQQLLNYPFLNFLWIPFTDGVMFMIRVKKEFVENIKIYPMFMETFSECMTVMIILFPVICAIGIIQLIGFCFAIKDEADIECVFGDRIDGKKESIILLYKKKDRKSRVTKREFYTTIPMKRWQEKKEDICDRMNIHLVGEITYGGNKQNIGNRVTIKSAKKRKPKERGTLYDATF